MLDDFSKEHKCLGSHLKNWADHYPFIGESKGGSSSIRPKRIIVTSNYHPSDIFEDDVTVQAIERRFKIEFKGKVEMPPILQVKPVVNERL